MAAPAMNRSLFESKRYIAERGLVPFTQRPEYCQCQNCITHRAAVQLEAAGQAIIRAYPQLLKDAA